MSDIEALPGDSPGAKAETAYRLGYSETEDFAWDLEDLGVSCESVAVSKAHRSLSTFKESARWANIVAPQLRELAGYEDSGVGTYSQIPDDSVVHRREHLVDYFGQGYVDGLLAGTEWE
jgi:hypothetical protein